MAFSTLFFDLDETLYRSTTGLWEAMRQRMIEYLCQQMRLSPDEVAEVRRGYYQTYGTTLRGLMINYPDQTDAFDYLAFVHDVPVEDYLSTDLALREMLLSLPEKRWVFTNSDLPHARRVIAALGLDGCFDGIIDLMALEFQCKPLPQAYERALTLSGEDDPRCCVFFDDSQRNLAPARDLGFFTVCVGDMQPHPAVCANISKLTDLPQTLPDLWIKNGGGCA